MIHRTVNCQGHTMTDVLISGVAERLKKVFSVVLKFKFKFLVAFYYKLSRKYMNDLTLKFKNCMTIIVLSYYEMHGTILIENCFLFWKIFLCNHFYKTKF